jgi:hypothetical protein
MKERLKMKKISRREVLKLSIAATGALGAPWLLAKCEDKKSFQEHSKKIKAQVAAIRGESIELLGEKIDNLQTTWKPAQLKG